MRKLLAALSIMAISLVLWAGSAHAAVQFYPPAQDAETTGENDDPIAVLTAFADAVNSGNAEQVASLFAEGSVSVALPPPPNSNGVSIGREEIGGGWAAIIDRHAEITFTDLRAYDNKVTWTVALTEDVFRYLGAYPIYFRAVAVIEDGQIQSTTWIMHKESIAQLGAAGHKTIARRVIEEAWNQGNLDTIDELYAAETVYHDPDHADATGAAAVKDLITEYRTAFPDLQLTIEQQIVEGDTVATRWRATGSQQGAYRGIAPTGKPVTLSGITLLHIGAVGRVEERQILESWTYWDSLGLLEQLGVAPTGGQ